MGRSSHVDVQDDALLMVSTLKTMTYQFEWFSLDHVSEELLGENKLIQATDKLEAIKRLYHSDPLHSLTVTLKIRNWSAAFRIKPNLSIFSAAIFWPNVGRPGGSVAAFLNIICLLHRKSYVAG